ncbi:alkaline phosphatase family protein [Catenovulum sediminis]|uniref:Alkaline phosphatase family protein n=1 Tax=Catenovulum sediminis TaxID=1740262 RepID=A0ABV1RHX1_9ALTE
MSNTKLEIPEIIAGPIIRQVSAKNVTFWLVTAKDCQFKLRLSDAKSGGCIYDQNLEQAQVQSVQVGQHAFIQLINVTLPNECLPVGEKIFYDIRLSAADMVETSLTEFLPDIIYSGEKLPSFHVPHQLKNILHGSCRKPHHPGPDAFLQVDKLLSDSMDTPNNATAIKPDLLLLTGDQIYADDVAGPTLNAIQQVVELLGLYHEPLEGATITDSKELANHPYCYYHREELLPKIDINEAVKRKFFSAKRKPVFTSDNAKNHLIALNEVLAMYFLVWSPALWSCIKISDAHIETAHKLQFANEQKVVERFVKGLYKVQRAMAHLPVYMIFDDHDVTDDWNLTRGWEEVVYSHPFSKRIIGNALIGYLLCQAWGNKPDKMDELVNKTKLALSDMSQHQNALIDTLFTFEDWHYQLDTHPAILVLDTRTRRWRSESNANKPSGLMDWEALCELQQNMIGHQSVIMVSAAPVYGNKLIESIQKIFTFFGKALMVDAENWMAHRGTANVMLNIFRHFKTPPNFIILSGDVHYSFVYDIRLKFRKNSPQILQFTCSGIKNEFPKRLLSVLDRLNKWLFSARSPLNVLTKRRYMTISHRIPATSDQNNAQHTLHNASAIGLLTLDKSGHAKSCKLYCANGKQVEFLRKNKNS